jgi:hypothetical protein
VSGSQAANQNSAYDVQDVFGVNDAPGSRMSTTGWVDAQGSLWLFGGWGLASGSSGNLNDLWMYLP